MSRRLVALVAVLALALAGCAGSPSGTSDRITVFAAASLQGAFDNLARAFTAAHGRYSVAPIVYDGSQALATQLVEGADADVVAFADESSLRPVTAKGITGTGTVFATNTLRMVVAPDNPKHIESLAGLGRSDVSTVLCAPQVPCGQASRRLLDAARVTVHPVSEETSVTGVVTRVTTGEADAGLVYRTDAAAAGDALAAVTPAGADAVVNRYPIAVTTTTESAKAAQAFVDFVVSAAGRKILQRYGFGAP